MGMFQNLGEHRTGLFWVFHVHMIALGGVQSNSELWIAGFDERFIPIRYEDVNPNKHTNHLYTQNEFHYQLDLAG